MANFRESRKQTIFKLIFMQSLNQLASVTLGVEILKALCWPFSSNLNQIDNNFYSRRESSLSELEKRFANFWFRW